MSFCPFFCCVDVVNPSRYRLDCPTKVQLIKRKQSDRWYINFPAAVAQAMEFERGETVEWIIEDKESLVLRRQKVPPSAMKKTVGVIAGFHRLFDKTRPGFTPGAYLRARPHSGDEFFGRLGASDRKRHTVRQCPAVHRLVGSISAFRVTEI